LAIEKAAGALAQKALGDGVVGVTLQSHDTTVSDRRDDPAGVRAVAIACGQFLHGVARRRGRSVVAGRIVRICERAILLYFKRETDAVWVAVGVGP
jgi:hypothetical protein